jgi:TNF receptor-associated protein 1
MLMLVCQCIYSWYFSGVSWWFRSVFTEKTGLDSKATEEIITFLSATLSGRASKVKVTRKLESHPCVVTVEEMGAARHFVRTQSQAVPEEQRYKMLQPQLEINPK